MGKVPARLYDRQGQTLIETALLLPLVVLTLVVLLELGLLLSTRIRLHHTASLGSSQSITTFTGLPSLRWGVILPTKIHYDRMTGWKAYPVPGVRRDGNFLQSTDVSFQFFPHFIFHRWIPPLTVHAYSEHPQEPRVPQEGA